MNDPRLIDPALPGPSLPLPLLFGVSERAARRLFGWDLLGLTRTVALPFFPQRLTGLHLVLGFTHRSLAALQDAEFTIRLVDVTEPTNAAWTTARLAFTRGAATEGELLEVPTFFEIPRTPESQTHGFVLGLSGSAEGPSDIELMPLPMPPLTVTGPGEVRVELEIGAGRYLLGSLLAVFAPPPPLADAERRALAARPNVARILRFQLGCPKCADSTTLFTTLDPDDEMIATTRREATYLPEAEDSWTCRCGKSLSLEYAKRGLHDLFRRPAPPNEVSALATYVPLFQKGRIDQILDEYRKLIEESPEEETVQKFLEKHPLFWGFLSPVKILHKPSVLTKKKADFGVLSSTRVLYLVEIEKPSTKLLTIGGAISAEIQKGADQIRDWELVVRDHRVTLLTELDLDPFEVHDIRYVLVGGLTGSVRSEGRAKLSQEVFGPKTQFLAFDELAYFPRAVQGQLDAW